MNEETMERMLDDGVPELVVSICKWYDQAYGKANKEIDGSTCALCFRHTGCDECPVCEETGEIECEGTPFIDLCNHINDEHEGKFRATCDECRNLAGEELDFLVGLLNLDTDGDKIDAETLQDQLQHYIEELDSAEDILRNLKDDIESDLDDID